ncbi:feruloyl-CoA synthase [Citreimonas salinaria]|uniref:Trans-feruloyl-CoA synthase n=1 Tax=Citreimonas salinaria TaxID=321339 RepID=A0A1H3LA79_9RHOB|nr:feruloyl-CoA synthase [Citreimonas salinaria]SDY61186.1 trans-feruloyl-CoA synthase [Citreimonas salinaria]
MIDGGQRLREVKVWNPDLDWEEREDGSWLIWRRDPLGHYPDRLTDKIDHWAKRAPDRTWMAERDGDGWRRVSYGEMRDIVRRIGAWLLRKNLSAERPLAILSEKSIEHALIALAGQYVGIPTAAVSPAYSLIASDFGKLTSIVEQITPGAVFVDDANAFAPAIEAALGDDVAVIALTGTLPGRDIHTWGELCATEPGPDVDRAHQAVGPDTVAKFLFTSGTTGSPKAVIQTNRMLCSNQAMILDCYAYMADTPPVLVDWAPWSHTASGNKAFNVVLWNGGTYYIDGGKPSPKAIGETVRNLREISPTWYFNVPAGFEALVQQMERDTQLRETFFRDLELIMYAGAGMATHTWRRLEELAVETVGHRILMTTGLGSTETAPFALYCTEPQEGPGNVGIPARGVTLKLVPHGDKFEARLKGPNVTPGYWRAPDLTKKAFDEDGFYKLGDALRFAEHGNPAAGFFFDGRIAENFKLRTGTWVAVGPLRVQLVDQMAGLVTDAVIVGENQETLGALLVPNLDALQDIAPDAPRDALPRHPKVVAALRQRLAEHAAQATGSATRVTRALVLTEPLSLERGEVTDKGSVNQRAVLAHRADLASAVYEDREDVITPAEGVQA